jgi:DNA-binding XRE family transcriptional regulator
MDKHSPVATETERWKRFGRYVRTYREDEAKMSQTDAARSAQMTRQQWNRIEMGVSGSKRTTIIKIAETLKADPVLFLNQAGFQEPEGGLDLRAETTDNIETRRLTRYFMELPRECQLDVLALTEALWKRRRFEGRAEQRHVKKGGGRKPRVTPLTEPGVERPPGKRRHG